MQIKPLAPSLAKAVSTLRGSKRDTLVTMLLLLNVDDPNLRVHCLKCIRQGSVRIDEQLVLRLYSAGDDRAKLAIASSVAVGRMRPRAFRQVFDPVYARSDISGTQRAELVRNLGNFLYGNPRQSPAYERILLELVKSSHFDLRVLGIQLAGEFARVDADLLAVMEHRMNARFDITRVASTSAFNQMLNRVDQLDSKTRAFLSSDAFRKKVARMHETDPDEDVRTNTMYLLRKLDRAFGPAKRRAARSKRRS